MICLPKVAINNKKVIEECKNSTRIIVVIDGCPLNCAEKILKDHGIHNFVHINTTDFGITKGKTPLMDSKINEMIKNRKNTYYSKSEEERKEITKKKTLTKDDFILKHGEEQYIKTCKKTFYSS